MWQRFGEAVHLLRTNLRLFSAIILTVWLPGNLLMNFLTYYVFPEDEWAKQIRLNMWIEGLFGPIYIGAMVHALSKLKQGHAVNYAEAMSVGFKNWGRLFAARFITGCIVLLGLMALIVPGVIFLARFAVLDPVVVLEGAESKAARARCLVLTTGIRGQIVLSAVVFFIGFILCSFLIYLPQSFFDQLDGMTYDVLADCLLDVIYAVIQIVMFLFYWEAKTSEVSRVDESNQMPPLPA